MIVFCTTYSEIGGIARVQQHIREILHANRMNYTELTYEPKSFRFLNQIRFIRELTQAGENASMIMFSHLHLFRAMQRIPSYDVSTVVFTHGLEMYQAGPEKIKELLNPAGIVITNSKYNEQWLSHQAGLKNVKSVYYPGLRFKIRSTTSNQTVLCVSRMMKTESYKGHEKLISAWAVVHKQLPESKLVMCGTGDLMKSLQKQAERLGLSNVITFTGHVSDMDLISHYQNASVFAMPSVGEGQGLVWQEAMQAGLPVIAVRETVAEEFVSEQKNGILVPFDYQEQDLAEAIIHALTNANWRAEVSEANHKKINDLAIEKEFRRVISDILQNKRN